MHVAHGAHLCQHLALVLLSESLLDIGCLDRHTPLCIASHTVGWERAAVVSPVGGVIRYTCSISTGGPTLPYSDITYIKYTHIP